MKYYLKHSLLYHSCNSYYFENSVNRSPLISTDFPDYINSTQNPSQHFTSIIPSVNPNFPKQVPSPQPGYSFPNKHLHIYRQ